MKIKIEANKLSRGIYLLPSIFIIDHQIYSPEEDAFLIEFSIFNLHVLFWIIK